MLNTEEQCIVCELEEMLDFAEADAQELREELMDTKNDLVIALQRIVNMQDDYINDLEDYVEELEDIEYEFEDSEDFPCCECCGEPLEY